jgi:23S rRNA (guanosine2251-2'-O)-methyltransferase
MKPLKIYGKQPVIEALRSNYKVNEVKIAQNTKDKQIKIIENLSRQQNVHIDFVPKNDLQKDIGPVVHQGVAAETEAFQYLNYHQFQDTYQNNQQPFYIALDQVQDPHNLGAIIRTAESAGVTAVILPEKGSAEMNATVAKTSAGAVFHTSIFKTPFLERTLEELNDNGISTFSTTPSARQSLYQVNLKEGICFVIGSEGKGVRKNILKLCTEHIALPQRGKVSSLNASVAAAIIIYEAVRQRNPFH